MGEILLMGARAGELLPWIIDRIREDRTARRKAVLIVPQQYTIEAEDSLIRGLGTKGLLDVDVLSPSRLGERIRESGGRLKIPELDDCGQVMAVSRALMHAEQDLTYYQSVVERHGMPSRLASLITDMEKAGMLPEDLRRHAESEHSIATRMKETDIAVVWEQYAKSIDQRFADRETVQRHLADRIVASDVLNGSAVYVYGFDMLQPGLLMQLLAVHPALYSLVITMVMDEQAADDGRIFLAQRRSMKELCAQMDALSIAYQRKTLKNTRIQRSPCLAWLERHLFSRTVEPWTGSADELQVYAAPDAYAEAYHAAVTLRNWHEKGMRWSEMAVALPDIESMPGMLSVVLDAAQIPYYLMRKDRVRRHAISAMLVGCLRAATRGFRSEDVLNAAKSGFTLLTPTEAMQLENYARANGIEHGIWCEPFTQGDDADSAEELRLKLMQPMLRLRRQLVSAKSGADSVQAIYDLLIENEAFQHLQKLEQELDALGMQNEATINRQVWRVLMQLLDQLYALLGEKRATLKEISVLVEAGLETCAISSLPNQPETVIIGEVGHLITGDLKALLLMSLQDGVTSSDSGGLITEDERMAIAGYARHPIGLSKAEQNALRLSDFYRTVALPTHELCMSYSQSSTDGAPLRESLLVHTARKLIPGLRETGSIQSDIGNERPLSPQLALQGLAVRLRCAYEAGQGIEGLDEEWQNAIRRLNDHEASRSALYRIVESLAPERDKDALQTDVARMLFRDDRVSVSKLEKFASCPYRHFIQYGLKPQDRKEFAFDAAQKGSFYHAVMENYVNLAASERQWPDLDEERLNRLIDRAVDPQIVKWKNGPLHVDALGRADGERFLRIVKQSARRLTTHARNNGFRMIAPEASFGRTDSSLPPLVMTLPGGSRMALQGVIDRIDRMDDGDTSYIRVVDYKSSDHSLNPAAMWYGLQLQLPLYLRVVEKGYESCKPAGALYFIFKDPNVEIDLEKAITDEQLRAEAEKKSAAECRLKGVVLADQQVLEAMKANTESGEIAKAFNKDGMNTKSESLYTEHELELMMQHAEKRAAELCTRMLGGEIDAAPVSSEGIRPCEYCEFKAICPIDGKMSSKETELDKMKKQEFVELLQKENSAEGTPDAQNALNDK